MLSIMLLLPLVCACFCNACDEERETEITKTLATTHISTSDIKITYVRETFYEKDNLLKLFPKDYRSSTEAITLTTTMPNGAVNENILMRKYGGGSDVIMRSPSAQIAVDPSHTRMAYQINEEPWALMFLLNHERWVPAPRSFLTHEPTDWSKIPTLTDHYVEVFLEQSSLRSTPQYQTDRELFIQHILNHHRDDLVTFILELEQHKRSNNTDVEKLVQQLTPQERALYLKTTHKNKDTPE